MLAASALLALLSAPVAAQTVSCPTRSANILFLSDDAWEAVEALELQRYELAILNMRAALACLSEPITPAAAAAMHRAEALSAVMNEDRASAVLSFRAALRLEPAWTLPVGLASDGGPFSSAYYEAAVPLRATPVPVVQGARLHAWLDGLAVSQRMRDLPVVFQYTGPDNVPLWSGYLRAGQEPPPPPYVPDPSRPRGRGARLGLSVGAGLTAAAGAALLYSARAPYSEFRSLDDRILNDPDLSDAAYDSLYAERDAHLHSYWIRAGSAGGLGALSAGLALGAALSW